MYAHLTDEQVGNRAWEEIAYADIEMIEKIGYWDGIQEVNRPLATEWRQRIFRVLNLRVPGIFEDQLMNDIIYDWQEYSFNWWKFPAVTEFLKEHYQTKLAEWIDRCDARRVC